MAVFCLPAYAEESKLKRATKGGPIVITSETLRAKTDVSFFEGSVVAKTGDLTVYSDKMTVFYDDAGEIERIEADGSVKMLRGEKVSTSSRAVLYTADSRLILTGEPKAVEGDNVITGTKIIYFIDEDRTIIEGSKVYLHQNK